MFKEDAKVASKPTKVEVSIERLMDGWMYACMDAWMHECMNA